MTNEELDRLEQLEKAATPIDPIPTVIRESGGKYPAGTTRVFHRRDIGRVVATFTEEQTACAYVATSGAFPALIAAARENAQLREERDRANRPWGMRLEIRKGDDYEHEACELLDIGHSDRVYLVRCDAVNELAAENARLRAELQNIVNAKTREPGNDWSAEFEVWAKNRARFALSEASTGTPTPDPRDAVVEAARLLCGTIEAGKSAVRRGHAVTADALEEQADGEYQSLAAALSALDAKGGA